MHMLVHSMDFNGSRDNSEVDIKKSMSLSEYKVKLRQLGM